ncbi:MAG: type I-G CRISPR-associated helicase/endonuclease Cas3g [Thermoplasmata archaeon]
MGGEHDNEWELYPERDSIIVGTQDMLLSRALNRGYGMSRYKWPVDFGLLNNDCLWVMDETQLMGVGVQTTAQMDAFRNQIGNFFSNTKSIWMSATFYDKMIETVDHKNESHNGWYKLSINEPTSSGKLKKIYNANKPIKKADFKLTHDDYEKYIENMAELILKEHKQDTLTLCIVNNVKRAQDIFRKILEDKNRNYDNTAVLHSRFREHDRIERMKILFDKVDRIIISTQVVEAGIDVSSRVMITELAPWSSFVQRIGRCNRFGEWNDAEIIWVDIDDNEGILPYEKEEMERSRDLIVGLLEGSPKTLNNIPYEPPKLLYPVIRKKDIVDLFDTTPDLTGYDVDVSRYIRSDKDNDVYVFWRDLDNENPNEWTSPSREELCGVSISDIRKYIKKYKYEVAWYWNHISGEWEKLSYDDLRIRPGQVILLNAKFGGYDNKLGWVGADSKESVKVESLNKKNKEDGMNDDSESYIGKWVTLVDHTYDVKKEVIGLCKELFTNMNNNGINNINKILEEAAHWHDVGKAHEAFQNMLKRLSNPPNENNVWGKSIKVDNKKPKYLDNKGNERLFFRHELASALAWLEDSKKSNSYSIDDRYLIAYLIASHHGKIRLSIRSMPTEKIPPDDILFARGVWEGDEIPKINGLTMDNIKLNNLSIVELGDNNWSDNMISLRDKYGVFKLAYLESILRIADWRSSKKEMGGMVNGQSQ